MWLLCDVEEILVLKIIMCLINALVHVELLVPSIAMEYVWGLSKFESTAIKGDKKCTRWNVHI